MKKHELKQKVINTMESIDTILLHEYNLIKIIQENKLNIDIQQWKDNFDVILSHLEEYNSIKNWNGVSLNLDTDYEDLDTYDLKKLKSMLKSKEEDLKKVNINNYKLLRIFYDYNLLCNLRQS